MYDQGADSKSHKLSQIPLSKYTTVASRTKVNQLQTGLVTNCNFFPCIIDDAPHNADLCSVTPQYLERNSK